MACCTFARTRLVSISFALACFALPLAARGEGAARTPTYAHDNDVVEVIYGSINAFDGRYTLQLRDDRGFFDNVELVQGTIINPTGQQLRAGMRVAIRGANRGYALVAIQIDTRNVPPLRSSSHKAASFSGEGLRPPEYREPQHPTTRQMQRYLAEQEAYHRAKAAYDRAEEAKARAAAQNLANKLARSHGGQGTPVNAARPASHPEKVAHNDPVTVARQTSPDVAKPKVSPSKTPVPVRFSDPAIAKSRSAPIWFGWGNL